MGAYATEVIISANCSNAFRTKSDLLDPDFVIASLICFASMGVNRAEMKTPLAF